MTEKPIWKITLFAKGYEGTIAKNFHLPIEFHGTYDEARDLAEGFSKLMKKTWDGSSFVTGRSAGLSSFNIR